MDDETITFEEYKQTPEYKAWVDKFISWGMPADKVENFIEVYVMGVLGFVNEGMTLDEALAKTKELWNYEGPVN